MDLKYNNNLDDFDILYISFLDSRQIHNLIPLFFNS